MSAEKMDVSLKPVEKSDSAEIFRELQDQIRKLIPDAGKSGRRWLRGKSDQELAKGAEIWAAIEAKLGQLDIDRQRLVQDRDALATINRRENKKEKNRHDEVMFKLETERMTAKADALAKMLTAVKGLQDMGIEIDVTIVQRMLTSS